MQPFFADLGYGTGKAGASPLGARAKFAACRAILTMAQRIGASRF
jgi:hypothetical protein